MGSKTFGPEKRAMRGKSKGSRPLARSIKEVTRQTRRPSRKVLEQSGDGWMGTGL